MFHNLEQGLKLNAARDKWGLTNPRVALWRWRKTGGNWTYYKHLSDLISSESFRELWANHSSRLYVRLKGTCPLAGRALSNTGE